MLPANHRRPSRCPPSPREAEQTTERGRGTPRQAACNPSPSAAHGIIYSSRIQLRGVAQPPPLPPQRGGWSAAECTPPRQPLGESSPPQAGPGHARPPANRPSGVQEEDRSRPPPPTGGRQSRAARAPPRTPGGSRGDRGHARPPPGGPSGSLQGRLHLPHSERGRARPPPGRGRPAAGNQAPAAAACRGVSTFPATRGRARPHPGAARGGLTSPRRGGLQGRLHLPLSETSSA
jgi:hypothetical protein